MDKVKQEGMLINAICIVLSILFLLGIVYNVTRDDFHGGVDDLFTVMVCLALALVFAINPLYTIWSGPIGEKFRNRKSAGKAASSKATS
jgi:hypothetical protein